MPAAPTMCCQHWTPGQGRGRDSGALVPARGGSARSPATCSHMHSLHPNIFEVTINSSGTKFLSVWQVKM